MALKPVYWWYKTPFARILFSLITGIITQWQWQLPVQCCVLIITISFLLSIFYSFLPINLKFRFRIFGGLLIHFMVMAGGTLLVWNNDPSHQPLWTSASGNQFLVAVIEEPLVEKPNSYKSFATIQSFIREMPVPENKGKIIIYFKKDSAIHLHYGSRIIFKKPVQEIRNSGNPGSFDYKQYCLFNGINGQVYLDASDFKLLHGSGSHWFYSFILATRTWVISSLRQFIQGNKEQGLAEALLIGYKEDLDKNLVQAYANTGVVHVIAISGLHLGLIYWLLLLITQPLKKKTALVWLRLVIILCSLWIFSILAGAQPSVLRSAVMFSFMAWGSVMQKRASIFNTLALSAFVLLCYNPFWLWDVGFQLSYAAVLSILVFFKPIYRWFSFENRLLDLIWKLMSVTLAAQLLTLPVSIYHFHQLPTLFLLTNIVAVPLSSLILLGEIFLCVFSFSEVIAGFIGSVLEWMIILMNHYIENMNRVSFAVWDGLSINILQAASLMILISCFSSWLMEPNKFLLWISLMALLITVTTASASKLEAMYQRQIIVYNIPKRTAIDIMDGTRSYFWGDENLMADDFLRNFHIRPCRILHRIQSFTELNGKEFKINGRQLCLIDSVVHLKPQLLKPVIDLLVLSKNPKIEVAKISQVFTIRQVVVDSSVPAWKARQWKKQCDSLHIACHLVSEKGAYIMNW